MAMGAAPLGREPQGGCRKAGVVDESHKKNDNVYKPCRWSTLHIKLC
jgi:hypothetical protein